MPPLKIAVALGLVLGWPGLAAAQSGEPADAARPAVPAAGRGGSTSWSNPPDDPSSLDRAAARFNDVVAGKTPATQPASPPHTGARLPISPPHHVRLGEPGSRPGGATSLLTVGGSLAVVLGLFLLVAWALKRAMPGRSGLLPSEVVEVLGRASLGARQQVHLVRCGSKLLLVSATPGGMETLTEIAEPDEVQRLAALCRQTQPGSTTATFRKVFQQLTAGAGHDA